MTQAIPNTDTFFTSFDQSIAAYSLPERFTYPFEYQPHPLCLLASSQLQVYLSDQKEWEHNFGLKDGKEGVIIGKMFGVLVVKTEQNKIGYLAAFSGKLASGNHHSKFVPPVFDMLTEGSFLNKGMTELTSINQKIKVLEEFETVENLAKIDETSKIAQKKLYCPSGKTL